jgi:hypothetical protein
MPLQNGSTYVFPSDGRIEDPNEFPWLRRDYNPDVEDKLCDICRQINFNHLFQENLSGVIIRLGTIADAKKRQCSLCGLLLKHAQKIPAFSGLAVEDGHDIRLATETLWEGSTALHMSINFGWWPVGSLRLHRLDKDSENIAGSGRWHPNGGVGQRVLPEYSPFKVHKWIQECELATGDEAQPDSKLSIPRFIDTKRECLVEASSLPDTQRLAFAALSYVWGSRQQKTTLTRDSYDRLHQLGSLAPTNMAISKTIRDAIVVCKDVGVPLLWVDALCIVQDGSDKMEHINKMHEVYEGAMFTIIAANGNNAEAGLPGVSEASTERQFSVRVQELLLIMEGSPLDRAIESTHWSTRAWTYQEFLLSRKRIIFSDTLIYFACKHGTYPEDQIRLHEPPARCSGHTVLRLEYKVDWQKLNWTIYADYVSKYTSKSLTCQEDVIPAFTALIEVMKREIFVDTPFIWAIPYSCLDAALLWRRCLGCDECGNTSRGLPMRGKVTSPVGGSHRAPVWSWVGRRGHVKYSPWFLNHANPALSIIPSVNWLEGVFLANRPLQVHPARSLGKGKSDSPIRSWTLPFVKDMSASFDAKKTAFKSRTHQGRWLSQPFDPSDLAGRLLIDPYQDFLFLEADTAKFAVVGRLFNLAQAPRERGDYDLDGPLFGGELGHPLAIFDAKAWIHCGVVYDDEEPEEDWPALCSFVKLSQTTLSDRSGSDPDEDWSEIRPGPGKDRLGHVKGPRGGPYKDDFHSFFDYEKYDCDRKWPVYNVLMVGWQDGTVAVRLGVGKIHVDAFDNAETFERKKFYLA